jgi:hypothetical protein
MYLCDDILISIFEYLSIYENLKFRKVCKKWNEILTYVFLQTKHLSVCDKNYSNLNAVKSFYEMEILMQHLPNLSSLMVYNNCTTQIQQLVRIKLPNILRFKVDKMNCLD